MADAAVSSIEAALHRLKRGAAVSKAAAASDAPPREELRRLGALLKSAAAKCGLLASEETLLPEALRSLLDGLSDATVQLLDCMHASTSGAGPTLLEALQKAGGAVATPAAALARALDAAAPAEEAKRLTGRVLDACDALQRLPPDNRAAILRRVLASLAVLADVAREMAELAEGGGGEGSGRDDDDDGDDVAGMAHQGRHGVGNGNGAAAASSSALEEGEAGDLDYDGGPLSDGERALLATCRELIAASGSTVKALARALMRGPPLSPSSDGDGGDSSGGGAATPLEQWELVHFHARHVQRCVEDLGAALYPPQDVGEALGAAHAAAAQLTLMLDEAPARAREAEGGALDALAARVEAAAAALPADPGAPPP